MSATQQTLDMLKAAYGAQNELAKSISTATGLVAFDLQAPAKNLYPVLTPLRNKIPRVDGKGGTATNWRQVNAILGSGYEAGPWVPEGQRAGRMSYDTSTKSASYATIGEEDALTFEARSAAQGFEDVRSTMTMRLLQKMMIKEEKAILGGNATLKLGTSATPTLSAAGSDATLPAATYSVKVVQLTFEGLVNSSIANGVATSQTVAGADGDTFKLNGGSGMISAGATQDVTLGQALSASVVPTQGALGYAWYVGTAGAEVLQAITTVPSLTLSGPLLANTQPATSITGDSSANPDTAFDGLLSAALNPNNTAYVKNLRGATLTSSGRSSINELDVMLKEMWDKYRLSPTVIYVNSQEQQNITNKVLNGTSGSLLRQQVNVSEPGAIIAGNVVAHYYNPFTSGEGVMIPIKLHPDVPAGTLIAWADNLPAQYQSNEVPNVVEMHVRQDYYEIEWPQRTRKYEHGVYAEEVLAVYAPFAMGVICGIGNG